MNLLQKFARAVTAINEWVGRIVGSFLLIMMLVTAYEVVARHFFDSPTIWTFELSQYLLCALTALAGGYTLSHGEHVNVEIVYSRWSEKTKALIDLITSLIFFAFVIFFLSESAKMAIKSIRIREYSESVWGPPIYPVKIAILIGVVLIFLQGLAKFINDLKRLKAHMNAK